MSTHKAAPFKWPFPPRPQKKSTVPQEAGRGQYGAPKSPGAGSRLADVVMVVFWGASIPGFMWLGELVGF